MDNDISHIRLSTRQLSKNYGGKVILEPIDFDVRLGEVVVILGRSGAGKSTFLRLLSLLEPATSGEISLDGVLIGATDSRPIKESVLSKQRVELGMVFQNFNLFPHLTVFENLSLGARVVLKMEKSCIKTRAEEILERIGLSDQINKYPPELSGGQQQRVAIARALMLKPKVMLFDEPTSALDPELVRGVLSVLESLADDGMTMVIVTHEVAFAKHIANRVALFENGELAEFSSPDIFFSSEASVSAQEYLKHLL